MAHSSPSNTPSSHLSTPPSDATPDETASDVQSGSDESAEPERKLLSGYQVSDWKLLRPLIYHRLHRQGFKVKQSRNRAGIRQNMRLVECYTTDCPYKLQVEPCSPVPPRNWNMHVYDLGHKHNHEPHHKVFTDKEGRSYTLHDNMNCFTEDMRETLKDNAPDLYESKAELLEFCEIEGYHLSIVGVQQVQRWLKKFVDGGKGKKPSKRSRRSTTEEESSDESLRKENVKKDRTGEGSSKKKLRTRQHRTDDQLRQVTAGLGQPVEEGDEADRSTVLDEDDDMAHHYTGFEDIPELIPELPSRLQSDALPAPPLSNVPTAPGSAQAREPVLRETAKSRSQSRVTQIPSDETETRPASVRRTKTKTPTPDLDLDDEHSPGKTSRVGTPARKGAASTEPDPPQHFEDHVQDYPELDENPPTTPNEETRQAARHGPDSPPKSPPGGINEDRAVPPPGAAHKSRYKQPELALSPPAADVSPPADVIRHSTPPQFVTLRNAPPEVSPVVEGRNADLPLSRDPPMIAGRPLPILPSELVHVYVTPGPHDDDPLQISLGGDLTQIDISENE